MFVLKHLIDKYRISKKHLFVCFVDFKKAYDSVRRDLLMRCLADMGLHDHMLTAIVSMYWNAALVPVAQGQVGQPFDSTRGVKQGDPLSPLLFGIFIDRLEKWFEQRLPGCGVQIGEQLVRLLLYADDLALLAEKPVQLQQLLLVLHQFCTEFDLEVNVSKTEIVVFGKKPYSGSKGWCYNGQIVPVSHEFKYLGLIFHETKGVTASIQALATAGRRAMWAMLTRCGERGISSLSMKVRLFDMLVSPILGYCSEVWAPALLFHPSVPRSRQGQQQLQQQWQQYQQQVLSQQQQPSRQSQGAVLVNPFLPYHNDTFKSVDKALGNEMQFVQFMFLRTISGRVRKSTPRHLLLRELGCHPLIRSWFISTVGLWNRLAQPAQSDAAVGRVRNDAAQGSYCSLLKAAMRDNWQLAREFSTDGQRDLWCFQFEGFLSIMQKSFVSLSVLSDSLRQQQAHLIEALSNVQSFHKVNAAHLIQCFDSWFSQKWFDLHPSPRTAPSTQVTWSTYENWFSAVPFSEQDMNQPSSWISEFISASSSITSAHVGSMLRFKLAAHDLQICAGRWQGQARGQRICSRCQMQQVEDEFHMVFECPFYDALRERFGALFSSFGGFDQCRQVAQPTGDDMRSFMQQKPRLVAAFIHACWLQRCSPVTARIMMPEVEEALEDSDEFLSIPSSGDSWFECEDV